MILVIECFTRFINLGPFDSEDDAWDYYIEMENPPDFVSFNFVPMDSVPSALIINQRDYDVSQSH